MYKVTLSAYGNIDHFEQTPHSHSPASKGRVGGGLEWGIFI